MDIRMPVMDGYTAAFKIREFNKHVIIFALSAGAIKAEKEKSLKSGMNDYLPKPLTTVELEKILEKYFTVRTSNVSDEVFSKKRLSNRLGNEEVIKIALQSFLEDVQKNQLRIKNMEIIPENLAELTRIFHTVKGQALNLSLPKLKKIAENAEFLAETDQVHQIKAIIPIFLATVKETMEAINK
jgi:CheY-like chemotaxis protein